MKYLLCIFVAFSSALSAGGWSNSATPTRVDIERGNGFMVYGEFGNAGGCTSPNKFYVQKNHPQYSEIYSTVLTAFTAGKKVSAYIHGCNPVGWYSVDSVTYNTLMPAGSLIVKN
jgi:hypothetical protein